MNNADTLKDEREELEEFIDDMSEEELKKWCKEKLFHLEDYGQDMWIIDLGV